MDLYPTHGLYPWNYLQVYLDVMIFPLSTYCTIWYNSEPAPGRPSLYSLDRGKSCNWPDITSDIVSSTMSCVLHYDIITPPCSIYSLASEGECPLECSFFIVLQILRSIPLSSILYLALRIRPLTLFHQLRHSLSCRTLLSKPIETSAHIGLVSSREPLAPPAETW